MLRALPIIVALGLAVYALIDCLQADPAEIRGPRRPVWVALIVLIPIVGPATWLISRGGLSRGRSQPRARPVTPPPVAPDDNPEFLSQLRDIDEQHEEMLTEWEADLRRREEEMRHDGDDGDDGRPG